jgi:hypothetical protein
MDRICKRQGRYKKCIQNSNLQITRDHFEGLDGTEKIILKCVHEARQGESSGLLQT